jgi:hypothetical protein
MASLKAICVPGSDCAILLPPPGDHRITAL